MNITANSVCFDFQSLHSLVLLDHLLASSGMESLVCKEEQLGVQHFWGEKKNQVLLLGRERLSKSGVRTSPAPPAFQGAPEKCPLSASRGVLWCFPHFGRTLPQDVRC